MRRTAQITLLIASCVVAIVLTAMAAGIRINITPSYPIGVYQIIHEPITKGSMVIFCPPDNVVTRQALNRGYIMAGFCPGGYSTLIKKVFAIKGDKVKFTAVGIYVNENLIPNSQPKKFDSAGRSLNSIETGTQILDGQMIMFLSDYNPKSFDGRYFGFVNKTSYIVGTIKPIWVW